MTSSRKAAAIRRTWRRLRSSSASHGPRPAPLARRVLTSTKTSVVAVEDHEVELAVARAVVARDERVAEALEVGEGEILADAAEVMTQVGGHDGDARERSRHM